MQPVVDGLEAGYGEQVAFKSIDANSPDGQEVFQFFRLRGHPSYVILSRTGENLWFGLGEQPAKDLERQIRMALERP